MTKLLVIEDEDSLRDSIADLLEAEGYEVLQAENGLTGVQLAGKHLPDLIICDVMMPVSDGYDVLNKLRSMATTADIPLIFLTARAESPAGLGSGRGSTGYLRKPFTRAALLAIVQTRLEQRAAASGSGIIDRA